MKYSTIRYICLYIFADCSIIQDDENKLDQGVIILDYQPQKHKSNEFERTIYYSEADNDVSFEPLKKRIKINEKEFLKTFSLHNLGSLNENDEAVIRSFWNKQILKDDFKEICLQIDKNIDPADFKEVDKHFLEVVFPFMGKLNTIEIMMEIYISIIVKINSILLNMLSIFYNYSHLESYKIISPSIENYANYKRINSYLFNMCQSNKDLLNQRLVQFINSGPYIDLHNNLNHFMKKKDSGVGLIFYLYRKFAISYSKYNLRDFLLLSIIAMLHRFGTINHHIPNSKSLFLHLISILELECSNLYLFCFFSNLKYIEFSVNGSTELERLFYKRKAFAVLKFLLQKNFTSNSNDFLKKITLIKKYILRTKVRNITLKQSKFLLSDFLVFVSSCDNRILDSHIAAIDNNYSHGTNVDLIIYELYKELESIYNLFIFN